jgi:hypothetical protein
MAMIGHSRGAATHLFRPSVTALFVLRLIPWLAPSAKSDRLLKLDVNPSAASRLGSNKAHFLLTALIISSTLSAASFARLFSSIPAIRPSIIRASHA